MGPQPIEVTFVPTGATNVSSSTESVVELTFVAAAAVRTRSLPSRPLTSAGNTADAELTR